MSRVSDGVEGEVCTGHVDGFMSILQPGRA